MAKRERVPQGDDERQTSSLTGLLIVLALLVLSAVIVRKIQVRVMMEQCMMSQRPGCRFAADSLRVSRLVDSVLDRLE